MTYDDFTAIIKQVDFPTYEADFPKSKTPPVVVFQKGVDKSVHVDGIVVYRQEEVIINLCTTRTDTSSRRKLEKLLLEKSLSFAMKDSYWISDESFYITEYRGYLK